MAAATLLSPGSNCWRLERADDFSIIIDADDYFASIRDVMMAAKRMIFLVGWDFDAGITIGHPDVNDGAPLKVGDFLLWLTQRNPGLEIRILLWSPAVLASWARLCNLPYLVRWKWNPQILVRLDGKHPVGSSHHQKMLVIDDSIAFCGGIDITSDRWDTRQHLDVNPNRRRPNGSSYGPWHDASSLFSGKAALALADLCRHRWMRAGGPEIPRSNVKTDLPETVRGFSFGSVNLAIARTSPSFLEESPIVEVEQLYIDMIMAAERLIYAESQYFASRAIAQAIANVWRSPPVLRSFSLTPSPRTIG